MLKLTCTTKCSILHIYHQFHNEDNHHFTLTLAILPSAAVPHLERGTAALEPRHCHDLSERWKARGCLYFSHPLQCLSLLPTVQFDQNIAECSSPSPPLVTLSSQASPLISPSIIERKRSQTRLESRSTDFPTLKSIWFTFWPVVVFITLGALLLAC